MIVRAYYCSGRGGADVELRLSPLTEPFGFEKHTSSVHKTNCQTLPYLQDSKNEWGVPVASISDTNAKPPDTSFGRKGTQLRKVVTAISATRRWSRKKVSSTGGKKEASPIQGNNGEQVGLQRPDSLEKELPTLPGN